MQFDTSDLSYEQKRKLNNGEGKLLVEETTGYAWGIVKSMHGAAIRYMQVCSDIEDELTMADVMTRIAERDDCFVVLGV